MFKKMDKNESKLLILRGKNEIMRGYLHGIVGPIDPNHPKITLIVTLQRKQKGLIQMVPFLGAC